MASDLLFVQLKQPEGAFMSLDQYFKSLIQKVESSDIQNNGKDPNGFFEPTRKVLLQRLNLLKDLHANPRAKGMVQTAWKYVTEHLPAEWLTLSPEDRSELQKILK
jgi:hypothetical protein